MSKPTNFLYDIGDVVMLFDLRLPATISARADFGHENYEYRVIYWCESKRCSEWITENEILKKIEVTES